MICQHDFFIIEAGCVLCEEQTGTLLSPSSHHACLRSLQEILINYSILMMDCKVA